VWWRPSVATTVAACSGVGGRWRCRPDDDDGGLTRTVVAATCGGGGGISFSFLPLFTVHGRTTMFTFLPSANTRRIIAPPSTPTVSSPLSLSVVQNVVERHLPCVVAENAQKEFAVRFYRLCRAFLTYSKHQSSGSETTITYPVPFCESLN
jgi:hypothetical protein